MTNFPKVSIRTTDDFFMVENEYKFDASKLGLYHSMNRDSVMNDMVNDTNIIIVPNTFTTLWEFDEYVKLCVSYNYTMIITESDADWKFHVEECFNRNSHGVPIEAIQNMKNRWVPTNDIFESIIEKNNIKVIVL